MILKSLSFFIITFIPSFLFGQELVVQNIKQYVLYNGIENHLDFALKSVHAKDVEIIAGGGSLKKIENHFVYENCTKVIGIVWFYAINKKTKKIIDSAEFRLEKLPDPEIYPQPLKNIEYERGYVGKNLLLDSPNIRGRIRGFEDYYVPIEIQEFTITINSISLQTKTFVNTGAIFTKESIDSFKDLHDKDTVTFGNIKVKVGCEDLARTLTQKLVYQKQQDKIVMIESK